VQTSWIKKIDNRSRATGFMILSLLIGIASLAASSATAAMAQMNYGDITMPLAFLALLLIVTSPVLFFVGIFGMRRSLQAWCNTIDLKGLRLSGAMLFFFHILYLQYHFTRIAEWQRTGTRS
jgi:succinate dehydrogenase/fumarate reductase cytochrome b subunit